MAAKQIKKKTAAKAKPKSKAVSKVKAKLRSKAKPVTKPKKPVAKAKKPVRPKSQKRPSQPAQLVEIVETVIIQIDGDEIARRAYEIWESKGRPEGDGHHHWLEAEAELRAAKANKKQS